MLLTPTPWLQLGVNYRSQLKVTVSGDGALQLTTTNNTPVTFTLTVPWPQSLSGGMAVKPLPGLRLMASIDWTDWSSFSVLQPHFNDMNLDPNSRLLLDYMDNYTIHVGAEYAIGAAGPPVAVVRAGYSFDSNAVPDRTIDRQLQDAGKHTIGGGGGVRLGERIWIDAAGELLFGEARAVPDTTSLTATKYFTNGAPGSYTETIVSVELMGRYAF